ncbi:MAG TPA: DoxX family protein [Rariglobus sp.]
MSLKTLVSRTNASLWSPLVLRIVVGLVMAGHGSQKLFGWFGGGGFAASANAFASMGLKPGVVMAGLAGGGEFIGGVLLILGLFTRLAALNTAVIMAVAIWTVHRGAFFADRGGMEYPLVLLAAAIVLLETGGGALSIDSKLGQGVSTIKHS